MQEIVGQSSRGAGITIEHDRYPLANESMPMWEQWRDVALVRQRGGGLQRAAVREGLAASCSLLLILDLSCGEQARPQAIRLSRFHSHCQVQARDAKRSP